MSEHDPVNRPKHYTAHPSGIECIQITEHMGFSLGNAIKYIWRADLKADAIEDLKKARWYLDREIARREGVVAKSDQQPWIPHSDGASRPPGDVRVNVELRSGAIKRGRASAFYWGRVPSSPQSEIISYQIVGAIGKGDQAS